MTQTDVFEANASQLQRIIPGAYELTSENYPKKRSTKDFPVGLAAKGQFHQCDWPIRV